MTDFLPLLLRAFVSSVVVVSVSSWADSRNRRRRPMEYEKWLLLRGVDTKKSKGGK